MNDENLTIKPWSRSEAIAIPAQSTPEQIVAFAKPQLSVRDMKSIVQAFNNASYEMVSTFVWNKAAAILKRQIATLGMEFVGEMLGRTDLDEDSDPVTSLGDHEAI